MLVPRQRLDALPLIVAVPELDLRICRARRWPHIESAHDVDALRAMGVAPVRSWCSSLCAATVCNSPMRSPFPSKSTSLTLCVCPLSVASHSPVVQSQTLTSQSSLAVASTLNVGWKTTDMTCLRWPSRMRAGASDGIQSASDVRRRPVGALLSSASSWAMRCSEASTWSRRVGGEPRSGAVQRDSSSAHLLLQPHGAGPFLLEQALDLRARRSRLEVGQVCVLSQSIVRRLEALPMQVVE
jgi:hypothetical protein